MCDTFIAMSATTIDRSVIFGKNSDREANEAQIVEYHPVKKYKKNSVLKCTYLEIPQIEQTYDIIICRPFWMWGAEMGVNKKGVVIGNEAVFTKLKVTKKNVLTGMDLVRLALERSDSAQSAKQTIIDLLQKYDQGGICGYKDKNFTYHNSFIIADKNDAWVLETAGKYWAAKKVENYYAISNGLTIGSDFDEIHPEAESFARKKGWVKGCFNFASAYSDFLFTTFSACKTRKTRADEILKKNNTNISIRSAISHLRDHNNDDFRPSKALLGNTICAHAGNSITRNASQTTGSMIVHLIDNEIIVWITATSAPCISVFKPVGFNDHVLPGYIANSNSLFNENSYWWKNENLHREILKDYQTRMIIIETERNNLENELIDMIYFKNKCNFSTTAKGFEKHSKLIDKWLSTITKSEIEKPVNFLYKKYWNKLNKEVKLQI